MPQVIVGLPNYKERVVAFVKFDGETYQIDEGQDVSEEWQVAWACDRMCQVLIDYSKLIK